MGYYETWVASQKYHGKSALTYSAKQSLRPGSIVIVPLQSARVLGVVLREVAKPNFTTKPIERVIEQVVISAELLQLTEWMRSYYPAPLGQLLSLLLPSSLLQQSKQQAQTETEPPQILPKKLPPLTAAQQTVLKNIVSSTQRMHLLHGQTGSGKTRVYLELAAKQLANKQSVLLLTPEISLTPQLIAETEARFPGQTVLMHSNLTPAQRRKSWLQIASATRPLVVIGPRSALFSPIHKLGLIIMDEAHDSAYKQEQAPYYLTSRVAAKLAELHGAKVVLGSATPLFTDYYTFEAKKLPIHQMKELAITHDFIHDVQVVNLRDRAEFSRSTWLSEALLEKIQTALTTKTQSLIFLNRRGTARLVLCQDCGWQALCPNCDLPLTYHADKHQMSCHTCGFTKRALSSCPDCKSTEITFKSVGTKSIAAELSRLFPKAKIMRFDSDNKKAEALEAHYHSVRDGSVDIIVGTQLLAKGLDLPNLSVVGIVVADTSLYFPDFTAEERTYQLISQVIGRANRGHRNSSVVIQSYHPDNDAIKAALAQDYEIIYRQQLTERQLFGFPPFRHLLKLQIDRASRPAAQKSAEKLTHDIKTLGLPLEVIGPAPSFVEKTHNRYRWQVIVKSKQRGHLLKVIEALPAKVSYDLDPTHLL